MKQKYDIYIRSSIRSIFDKESNKSGLVNDLLIKHFASKQLLDKTNSEFKYGDDPDKATNLTKVSETVIKIPNDVAAEQGKLKSRSMQFCKEGHPIPEGRSKCTGKGCKYA